MLAADVMAGEITTEPMMHADHGSSEYANNTSLWDRCRSPTSSVVFVDPEVQDLETLASGIANDAQIILLNETSDPIGQITKALRGRAGLSSIHVISHGASGVLKLGGESIDAERLHHAQDQIRTWGDALESGGDLLLYGCSVGAGDAGQNFLAELARLTGADVAASDDVTGAAAMGGDWELESVIGLVQAPMVISNQARIAYASHLQLTVYAAGITGTEQMELQVDGDTVASWSNVGGDFASRSFESFTFDNASPVTADQVRIALTNDQGAVNGQDRNLVVDRIEIDGVVYQTEDESTFSTGTWTPDNNASVPGFRQNEWLHTNGFFQFADQDATELELDAAGSTGEEIVRLTIRGQEVARWQLSTDFETYRVSLDRVLDPATDEIRIEFLNDLFQPESLIDRNVFVAEFRLNGNPFVGDATDTFSTGTWTETDGIESGYGRGDTLHTNGFFQFDAPPTEIAVRASGDTGTESFRLEVDGQIAATFQTSADFKTFTYTHSGPVTANELRVVFFGDVFDENFDTNLNVDWIEVDGRRIETDSPFVFADGVFSDETQAIESGYGLAEKLNANGFFQYATGSVIEIVAKGDTGGESFEVVVDGERLARYEVDTEFETYRYISDRILSASEVRLEYSSDGFDPVLGDRNLTVDLIRIDGVGFESDASTTYSSGTGFLNGNVLHGFGSGETLFVNGFFQYNAVVSNDDAFSIPEDAVAVPLAVFANDERSEFNSATLVVVAGPQNGTLEIRDNEFYYSPNPEFVGVDSFSYDIVSNNGSLLDTPATVEITVNESHQQPQTLINPAVAPELTPSGEFLEVRRYVKLPTDENGRQPRMNSFATAGDRSFVVTDGSLDGTGEIYELVTDANGEVSAELFFDVAEAVFENTGLVVNNSIGLFGVRSVAFHPDFLANGKFYTTYTGDRPDDTTGLNYLSDPANPVPVDNVLAEWTVDLSTGQVLTDSYRELFRVGMIAADHPIQNMAFNPFAETGDADYGLLYIGHGDGSIQSAIAGDGQNPDGLGKILRIDPLENGAEPYSIPADNPFTSDPVFPDEIYALGFRNPHNLTFAKDAGGTVHLIVTDIGRDNVEEINLVVNGGNYGWADREGPFVHLRDQAFINGNIAPLPANEAENGYIYPVAILGHEGDPGQSFVGQAIIGGHVIQNGSEDLNGQFLLAEFATDGRAYHIDFAEMLEQITTLDVGNADRDSPEDLTWLTPQELTILFDHDNDPETLPLVRDSLKDVLDDEPDFAQIISAGKTRADIRFGQGPNGELLILNKRNGWVYIATNTESSD
ncbi:MAG: carbohydrate-binding domain-containing protein [Planctomycetota bacterium]